MIGDGLASSTGTKENDFGEVVVHAAQFLREGTSRQYGRLENIVVCAEAIAYLSTVGD